MGLDVRVGNNVQKYLIVKYLICSFNVSFERGKTKGLLLKEKGGKVLGIKTGKSNRNGGSEYRYRVKAIAYHLKTQGYEVTEEYSIGAGKTIDVFASRDRTQIALEVETGKSDAVANVRKCLDAGLRRTVIVTTSPEADKKVRDDLAGIPEAEVIKVAAALKQKW